MPGPGGGRSGGGGGRGGFSGGSAGGHHGGGMGGGFHGGPHRGFGGAPMGGFHHRHYRGGGGCCGGAVGIFAIILFCIFFVIYMILPADNSGFSEAIDGYNEEVFQDYADSQYAEEFGGSSAYEDNLLITVLVDEDYYNYCYIAWVGDHIVTDINYLMGNNDTELGQAMESCMNATSYKYSLDSNLAQVMNTMTQQIQDLGLESSYFCTENHEQVISHLSNYSNVSMTEETVNSALTAFTAATGIPVVIVVGDAEDVFGAAGSSGSFSILFLVLIAAVAVIGVTIFINRRKGKSDGFDDGGTDNRYKDFDF